MLYQKETSGSGAGLIEFGKEYTPLREERMVKIDHRGFGGKSPRGFPGM